MSFYISMIFGACASRVIQNLTAELPRFLPTRSQLVGHTGRDSWDCASNVGPEISTKCIGNTRQKRKSRQTSIIAASAVEVGIVCGFCTGEIVSIFAFDNAYTLKYGGSDQSAYMTVVCNYHQWLLQKIELCPAASPICFV